MKKVFLLAIITVVSFGIHAQDKTGRDTDKDRGDKEKGAKKNEKITRPGLRDTAVTERKSLSTASFTIVNKAAATPVKDQAMTGTCWCFSTTSLIESQCLKYNLGEFDLSEMFSVRNTYLEKAKNYILRQGHTQFDEGGLGHDLINAIAKYGAMPESVYSGLLDGQAQHNHVLLVKELREYLDNIIKNKSVPENWQEEFTKIMNKELGTPPAKFAYKGKEYTPLTFASEVLKFNPNDYVYITSFTHHPYYQPFAIEVPDNFSSGMYYNLPLNEMEEITKEALLNGYTVLWDADVSNDGFQQKMGTAANLNNAPAGLKQKGSLLNGVVREENVDVQERQRLFENLTTQDDHLMHITGIEKSRTGSTFFLVKNSWGNVGPNNGYINVSQSYFELNTISLVIPKAAINKKLLDKLHIK